jgi:hypothetical protein
MGLINNDVYVAQNGVQKAGTYISFAYETLYLNQMNNGGFNPNGIKASENYSIRANYRIYWDKAARDAGMSFIDLKSVSTTVPYDMLQSNMYECLYEVLKTIYPNHNNIVSSTGPTGVSGPSGASGASGSSGDSGASGPSGDSGASGDSGPSGDSGTSGTSGASGASGDSGASGASGASEHS